MILILKNFHLSDWCPVAIPLELSLLYIYLTLFCARDETQSSMHASELHPQLLCTLQYHFDLCGFLVLSFLSFLKANVSVRCPLTQGLRYRFPQKGCASVKATSLRVG